MSNKYFQMKETMFRYINYATLDYISNTPTLSQARYFPENYVIVAPGTLFGWDTVTEIFWCVQEQCETQNKSCSGSVHSLTMQDTKQPLHLRFAVKVISLLKSYDYTWNGFVSEGYLRLKFGGLLFYGGGGALIFRNFMALMILICFRYT